jgi:hypothetical protein
MGFVQQSLRQPARKASYPSMAAEGAKGAAVTRLSTGLKVGILGGVEGDGDPVPGKDILIETGR